MSSRLERAGRDLLIRLITRVLPPRKGADAGPSDASPRRVLLVRHDDRIGNLVLLTPLLQAIREVWPDTETGVLIGPRFREVLQAEPTIDRLWILEKRRILRNPFVFLGFVRRLRRHRFDMAIDCSHMHSFSLTGAAMTWISGAPLRVAYDRGKADSFSNLLVDPLQAEHHESEILVNLLRPFVDSLPQYPMRLRLTDEERAGARRRLQARGTAATRPLLGIHVGGRDAKRWSIERHIAMLGLILERRDLDIVALCGPAERAEAARLRSELGSSISVMEDLSVREMMAIVACCDCFVSPDTGAMHVAVALGVPTAALFNQESWKRYGPAGGEHRVVRVTSEAGESEVANAVEELLVGMGPPESTGDGNADTE
jgi:ADP-heptose:LPS heptosyltransferase